MAGFREHIAVSSMLGLGYGAGSVLAFGFTTAQGALAGFLTAFGGMLPDLDSQTGKPIRELFSLLGAVAPLLMMGRVIDFLALPSNPETVILTFIVLYHLIRYGGAWLIGTFATHRGMFHSIPAMVIAGECVFLAYKEPHFEVKVLLSCAIAIGFLSHLILDEMYSVQWTGVQFKLSKSAGTAMKFVSPNQTAVIVTYALLVTLSYATLADISAIQTEKIADEVPEPELREASRDLPEFLEADIQ